jgi:hypothetical protein
MYPPLPSPPPPQPDDTASGYVLKVLAFVVSTGITASLTDDQLAQADHHYPIAIAHADVLALAVDRLTTARRLVLNAIAARTTLAQKADSAGEVALGGVKSGPGGVRQPVAPAPFVRPPAPVALPHPARLAEVALDFDF